MKLLDFSFNDLRKKRKKKKRETYKQVVGQQEKRVADMLKKWQLDHNTIWVSKTLEFLT